MYKWLLIPPDRDQISDVHYSNDRLEEIMTKYRENQRLAAAMFEKRKKDMMAKPLPGSDTPYIDPSDENSKFYTKPDIPPIPHPAEIVEELRKEFPDKTVQELVTMADAKVNEEIERRAK
jgi:Glu-tRNA(Gln) amidotransferase subunit E-like FAD-binding protein